MNETNQNRMAHLENEINLVDIWLILLRRKWLIATVFCVCVGLGVAASFLISKQYAYSSTFEIGSTVRENGEKLEVALIEDPETVKGKLVASYIPLAQAQFFETDKAGQGKLHDISVKIPKNSQILVLESKGTLGERAVFEGLHQRVADYLLTDHQRIIKVPQKNYEVLLDIERLKLKELEDPKIFAVSRIGLESKIQAAKTQLQSLKDRAQLIAARFSQLKKKRQLLTQQVDEVTEGLSAAKGSRSRALSEVTGEAKAMTLLLIDNQIEQSRTRLASLQERLFVQLEDEQQVLENEKKENIRNQSLQESRINELGSQLEKLLIDHDQAQEMQQQEIAKVQNKLDNLRPTRTLGVAVKSLKPTGPGKALLLALSGVLGMMGGVFAAFFVEFLSRVRQQQATIG